MEGNDPERLGHVHDEQDVPLTAEIAQVPEIQCEAGAPVHGRHGHHADPVVDAVLECSNVLCRVCGLQPKMPHAPSLEIPPGVHVGRIFQIQPEHPVALLPGEPLCDNVHSL